MKQQQSCDEVPGSGAFAPPARATSQERQLRRREIPYFALPRRNFTPLF
jgi:hypothetical protein